MDNIIAESGHSIIVIGPFVWGKAQDLITAKKNAEKENGHRSLKGNWIAVQVPEDSGVNEMGGYRYHYDQKDGHAIRRACCKRVAQGKEVKDQEDTER